MRLGMGCQHMITGPSCVLAHGRVVFPYPDDRVSLILGLLGALCSMGNTDVGVQ